MAMAAWDQSFRQPRSKSLLLMIAVPRVMTSWAKDRKERSSTGTTWEPAKVGMSAVKWICANNCGFDPLKRCEGHGK